MNKEVRIPTKRYLLYILGSIISGITIGLCIGLWLGATP